MEITKLPTCDECNEHPVVRFRCVVCIEKALGRSYLSGYQKGLKEAGRDRYRAIWVVAFMIACMVLLAFLLKDCSKQGDTSTAVVAEAQSGPAEPPECPVREPCKIGLKPLVPAQITETEYVMNMEPGEWCNAFYASERAWPKEWRRCVRDLSK